MMPKWWVDGRLDLDTPRNCRVLGGPGAQLVAGLRVALGRAVMLVGLRMGR